MRSVRYYQAELIVPGCICRYLDRWGKVTESPLRWAGSKRSLLPEIRTLIPPGVERYIEPFMGSACVFFDRLPATAELSDFNGELIHFFNQLQKFPKLLHQALQNWSPNGDDFYQVRACAPDQMDANARAARFLYLNKFAFNGVYRTNKKGQFNVPRGSRSGQLPSLPQLQSFGEALGGAKICQRDYLHATATAKKGDFVYLDPPYRNSLRSTYGEYGYGAFGEDADVKNLSDELERLNRVEANVILSFNDDAEIVPALHGWTVLRVARRRSVAGSAAHRTVLTGEILAYNFEPVAHA